MISGDECSAAQFIAANQTIRCAEGIERVDNGLQLGDFGELHEGARRRDALGQFRQLIKAQAQPKGSDAMHHLFELVGLLGGLQMQQLGAEFTVQFAAAFEKGEQGNLGFVIRGGSLEVEQLP